MKESVRNNIIGFAIAVVLLTSTAAGGYVYFKIGPRGGSGGSGKSDTQATALQDSVAAIKPEMLNEKRVRFDSSGDINEAYVDDSGKVIRLYQLSPPTMVKALQLAILKHEQTVAPVANLHERFHSMLSFPKAGTNGVVTETMAVNWDSFSKQNATLPELFERMSAVNVNDSAKADFQNVALLLRIARVKRDPQAVIYAYRIIHDLDIGVYNPHRSPLQNDPPPYGAAHAYGQAKKSQTAEIEAYITKNKK